MFVQSIRYPRMLTRCMLNRDRVCAWDLEFFSSWNAHVFEKNHILKWFGREETIKITAQKAFPFFYSIKLMKKFLYCHFNASLRKNLTRRNKYDTHIWYFHHRHCPASGMRHAFITRYLFLPMEPEVTTSIAADLEWTIAIVSKSWRSLRSAWLLFARSARQYCAIFSRHSWIQRRFIDRFDRISDAIWVSSGSQPFHQMQAGAMKIWPESLPPSARLIIDFVRTYSWTQ